MFFRKKSSSIALSKKAIEEIEKAESRILNALDKYTQIILYELKSAKKEERSKQPYFPLNITGIPFYTYDDCEPVLSKHLKEGEEPRVIRFGTDEHKSKEESSKNSGNDNSCDGNQNGDARNDYGSKT